jgi:glycosyltransferase involved in cell wall biosynthesis
MAIDRTGESLEYPWEAKFRVNQNDLSTYLQAASYINQSGTDLVSLQHEFGLFGGSWGEYVIPLIESLKRPVISTLHSVPEDPESDGGKILKRISKKSEAVIVMMEEIKKKLVKNYEVPSEKIIPIPHGTPDLPFGSNEDFKKRKRLSEKLVLGNINLLTPSRGVEYALEAVAILARKFPNILYYVIGQTHPVYLQENGERYRNHLKKLIRKLGIKKNVRFINRYLTLAELIDWLKTLDFYITPYLDPNQASSGALAYAIGLGKCCISTPYLYAREILADKRGVLVPFHKPKSIASAVIELWEQPDLKREIEKRAYEYGRLMTWSHVAMRHLDLFQAVLNKNGKG